MTFAESIVCIIHIYVYILPRLQIFTTLVLELGRFYVTVDYLLETGELKTKLQCTAVCFKNSELQ